MRKQRRAAASRVTVAASRASARKSKSKPVKRAISAAPARTAVAKAPMSVKTAIKEPVPPPPPPAPRKPAFYEALAIYETGVRALQRHDFEVGADSFRSVIQRYPEERELGERATLFLQVCERETARRASPPESTSDAVIAATVALNAGDADGALARLGKVLERAPESDHAHYIMAVALTEKGDSGLALRHLRQAITLNPDNRSNAIKDPDLSALRDLSAFQQLVDHGDAAPARRLRSRR
jgi:tetratricopeptide (TPR) repeat protein